jgi:hypothetical protein
MRSSTLGALLRALALAAALLALAGPRAARGASFVVEKSTVRVKAEGFAASFPSAIGDVS